MLRTTASQAVEGIAFPTWVRDLGPGQNLEPLPEDLRTPELTRSIDRGIAQAAGSLAGPGLIEQGFEWQEIGLCQTTDPEAFYPEKGGSTREAKRICGRCEVKNECLEYALTHDEKRGIWGGLSERERNRLKRRAA
ncbi:MAG TPA: WhiB family transcriptional regulator [Candidatus Pristimantibacillus sp.]|jgi:WhiB family redox-sensing transcriptional regulator|nr:WhiB family transcriptional regulator [Candidatus Pristimantibacillus sp.]